MDRCVESLVRRGAYAEAGVLMRVCDEAVVDFTLTKPYDDFIRVISIGPRYIRVNISINSVEGVEGLFNLRAFLNMVRNLGFRVFIDIREGESGAGATRALRTYLKYADDFKYRIQTDEAVHAQDYRRGDAMFVMERVDRHVTIPPDASILCLPGYLEGRCVRKVLRHENLTHLVGCELYPSCARREMWLNLPRLAPEGYVHLAEYLGLFDWSGYEYNVRVGLGRRDCEIRVRAIFRHPLFVRAYMRVRRPLRVLMGGVIFDVSRVRYETYGECSEFAVHLARYYGIDVLDHARGLPIDSVDCCGFRHYYLDMVGDDEMRWSRVLEAAYASESLDPIFVRLVNDGEKRKRARILRRLGVYVVDSYATVPYVVCMRLLNDYLPSGVWECVKSYGTQFGCCVG